MRAFLTFVLLVPGLLNAQAPSVNASVLQRLPHDPSAFTQGLVYMQDRLFESTGLYGESSLRELDASTLRVLKKQRLSARYFAEGLAVHNGELWQLTWKAGELFSYNTESLKRTRTLGYDGEGWGLTWMNGHFWMSDGSHNLSIRDPETFTLQRQLPVFDDSRPVTRLNELEEVDGLIWANVWMETRIAIISPQTGRVLMWLDLTKLSGEQGPGADVANGIAWQKGMDWVLVTGKRWRHAYRVRIPDLP